jgi:hypothetical protein
MLDDRNARVGKPFCIGRVAHVIERFGVATFGAMCGMFVAAHLARAGIGTLDSIGFIASMILVRSASIWALKWLGRTRPE